MHPRPSPSLPPLRARRTPSSPRGAAAWCLLLLAGGCSTSESVRTTPPELDPRYPAEADLDYTPRPGMAHAALPPFDRAEGRFVGDGRIWVKGSAEAPRFTLDGGPEHPLAPPFFTACVAAAPGPHAVVFVSAGGERHPAVEVLAPSSADLNRAEGPTTVLAYGCFDPFDIADGRVFVSSGDGTGQPGVAEGRAPRYVQIRSVLRAAAAGALPRTHPASLVIGAGDQVYVEPAHDRWSTYGAAHPLCAWTVGPFPGPRMSLAGFTAFLDRTYRAFWSFESLDAVLRSVPSVMTWDDHEIRDGWGSQGDEHIFVDTYYAAAREAFVEHQWRRGPAAERPRGDDPRAPLHQVLTVRGLPIFVLDERSARDVAVPQVLGPEQLGALAGWLTELDPDRQRYCLIVSPLPLLHRASDLKGLASRMDPESWDDMLDAWSSDANIDELNGILGLLVSARQRGLRPIVVSGDMHTSGLLRATFRSASGEGPTVFANEIVASGLASSLVDQGWKQALAREGGILADEFPIGPYRGRIELGELVSVPNFAAIEIDGERAFAHLFQARESGMHHTRVELRWGDEESGLVEELARGRTRIDVE